jgi:hypothetical protein
MCFKHIVTKRVGLHYKKKKVALVSELMSGRARDVRDRNVMRFGENQRT